MGKKGDLTRQKICDTARELFCARGYKDVSMQEICMKCGLSKGGLYRHFKDKGDILLTLVKHPVQDAQIVNEEKSATEILDAWFDFFRRDMQDTDHSLVLAMYEFASLGNQNLFTIGTEQDQKQFHQLIQYGIRTGEFNEVDSEMILDSFLYAFRGYKMWKQVLPLTQKTIENIIKCARELIVKSIKS